MNKYKILLTGGILVASVAIFFAVILNTRHTDLNKLANTTSSTSGTKQPAGQASDNQPQKNGTFMEAMQRKIEENQENYNANLVEFAEKRWEKLFLAQNNFGDNLSEENLKIVNQDITKEEDGSTVYKIKYHYQENEYADFFYLILSDTKLSELGIVDLKSNRFLSEDELKKNLNQPNFAKITKINIKS
jgi:hypothetical protein